MTASAYTDNEQWQDYLRLKAAVRGTVRSVQGRVWRRHKAPAGAHAFGPIDSHVYRKVSFREGVQYGQGYALNGRRLFNDWDLPRHTPPRVVSLLARCRQGQLFAWYFVRHKKTQWVLLGHGHARDGDSYVLDLWEHHTERTG